MENEVEAARRSRFGLLAIPALLAVLALAGMALSTERRSDFEQRAGEDQGQGIDNGSGQAQADDPRSSEGDLRSGDRRPGDDEIDSDRSSEESGEPTTDRIVINTRAGDVSVEFAEDGRPIRVVSIPSGEGVEPGRVFRPDADGDIAGVRVTGDGRLEPVGVGDLQPGDLETTPAPTGLGVDRSDGSRVELRPNENGPITGTEFGPDGTGRELVPDGEAVVVQAGSGLPPGAEIDPDSEPLLIETEAGPVLLDLESNGDLVATQPTRDEATLPIDPQDGEEVAVRVNEDGSLDVVSADEIRADDTVLVPSGEGIDLVRPDGGRVEFRPGGDNDGITATEISPDGQVTELTPNPDGSVTLEDGTTVGPIDFVEDGGVIEQLIDQTGDLPWPWVFGGIALLALLSIGTAIHLHRNRPDTDFDLGRFAVQGVPPARMEDFVAMLAADPDPARAIRLAFHTAERGMAGLPIRRAEETPFEWHGRVAQLRPDLADALAPICDLFAMARFAPGGAGRDDVSAMTDALRRLNDIAQSPARVSTEPAGV